MPNDVYVVIHKPALHHFTGWQGPVGRSVMRLARETRFRQMAMANKKTGRMAQSITIGPRSRNALGITTSIGAGAGQFRRNIRGYALYNDQGTSPHVIEPRRAPHLVFYWPKVGRVVRLKRVFHPGNRAYHWAMRGLVAAMRQWQRGG